MNALQVIVMLALGFVALVIVLRLTATALTRRRYRDRPHLIEDMRGRRRYRALIAGGVMRRPSQLSWHTMNLMYDAERGTLVIAHRGLHDLTGPFLVTPAPDELLTGMMARDQRGAWNRTPKIDWYTVLELRSLGDRRHIAIRGSRVSRLESVVAELNAALGYRLDPAASRQGAGDQAAEDALAGLDASSASVLTATITAALDAVPIPADQLPSPRKAALIARRRRLALAIGVFHRRNHLRSTAYPGVALVLAAVNAALYFGHNYLLSQKHAWYSGLTAGFTVPAGVAAVAAVVYARRAWVSYTRPDQRAAAAAELRALKLREPGSLPPRPGPGLTSPPSTPR